MFEPEFDANYRLFFEELSPELEIADPEPVEPKPSEPDLAYLRSDQVSALGQDAAELIDNHSLNDDQVDESAEAA